MPIVNPFVSRCCSPLFSSDRSGGAYFDEFSKPSRRINGNSVPVFGDPLMPFTQLIITEGPFSIRALISVSPLTLVLSPGTLVWLNV